MHALRRTAVTASRSSRTALSRQPRRFAHDGHAHGHAQVNEPMGKGFWFSMAILPIGWAAVYYATRPEVSGSQPLLTRLIDKYTEAQEELSARNDLHVQMMEQAGSDRVLFMNSRPNESVEMKFPEIMNVGSPYNVPAGSQVNMDKVIEKYQKLAYEDNERKLEHLRNNKIKSEQPLVRDQGPRKSAEN